MPSEAFERWIAISQQFPVGAKSRGGMLRSAEPSEDVVAGQIRQAYWLDSYALVLIAEVDEDNAQARVLPVSVEPGVENRAAIVIEAEASPLHGPVTVWPMSREWIPFAALDRSIATLPATLLRALQEVPAPAIPGTRAGQSDPALDSGGALAIDELFDALGALQRAPKLDKAAAIAAPTKLRVPLPLIMTTLQVSQPRAMAILIGKEPVTPEEAEKLAAATNQPAGEILAAVTPLPRELQRELQEPRLRAHIRARAKDRDEDRARIRLGYEAYQLAAREAGDGQERWRQRLDAVLAAESR